MQIYLHIKKHTPHLLHPLYSPNPLTFISNGKETYQHNTLGNCDHLLTSDHPNHSSSINKTQSQMFKDFYVLAF